LKGSRPFFPPGCQEAGDEKNRCASRRKRFKMTEKKFDPKKLQKLNDPQRLNDIPPDYILGKLDTEKPEVLVEIGAGTAFFCIAFLQRLKPSAIYACDVSEIMVNWMDENVTPAHPEIVALKTEEHSVPLGDGIADLVFMINLHHELENPFLTVEEARRLLKPGGEIFIVDWKKKEMPDGPPVEIRCLPDEVRDQLVASGYTGVAVFDDLPKHFLVVGKKSPEDT